MLEQLREYLTLERLYPVAGNALRFFLILLAAYVAVRISQGIINGLRSRMIEVMKHGAGGPAVELEKRAGTIIGITGKALAVLIWAAALFMALRELGFDIGPLLAGAGVAGLAIGFGAQNLVRDVISGLFILLENQVRVGDVAVLNGTGGLVEEVNLRTTVLRSLDGVVHVFPNGTIDTLSNMTRKYSFYVFDIGVAYKEDTDRVVEVLKGIADEMMEDEAYKEFILEPLEVLGVDKFADSAVIIKARIKTQPIKQWMIGREMNRRIKKKFDELDIEIPFPHQSIYFGAASEPFKLSGGSLDREGLKQAIREVLEETRSTPESEEAKQPATRSTR